MKSNLREELGGLAHISRLKSGKYSKQLFTSQLRAMRNRYKKTGIQLTFRFYSPEPKTRQ